MYIYQITNNRKTMKKLLILLALLPTLLIAQEWSVRTFNVSTMPATDSIVLNIKGAVEMGLQVRFRNITDTLNCSVDIFAGNTDSTFAGLSDISLPYTITTANETYTAEKQYLPFDKLKIKVYKGNANTGFIDVYFRAKKRF